jgi:hypothetical protein
MIGGNLGQDDLDERAVLRHAPEAARRSVALGAHREAAAQFERALRNAHNAGKPLLAALQEGVADEYALLDRWEEAEQARRAALALRRELGDELSVGKNLRGLSLTPLSGNLFCPASSQTAGLSSHS